jgi:transposase-like protein
MGLAGVGWTMPRPAPSDTPDRRATAMALLDGGATVADAARAVGADRKTVRRWKGGASRVPLDMPRPHPELVEAMTRATVARADAMTTAARAASKACAALEEVADLLIGQMRDVALDPRERRAAALELADRAGWTKQSHLEVSHTGAVAVDVSDFRARIERAYEAAKRAQSVEVAQGPQGAK